MIYYIIWVKMKFHFRLALQKDGQNIFEKVVTFQKSFQQILKLFLILRF